MERQVTVDRWFCVVRTAFAEFGIALPDFSGIRKIKQQN